MQFLELFLAGLAGLIVSLSVLLFIVRVNHRRELAKRGLPAGKYLRLPAPRLGGIALAGALLVVAALVSIVKNDYLWEHQRWLMLISTLGMFAVGLCDDFRPLGARTKLFEQFVIATSTYLCGIGIAQFRVPFTDQLVELGFWGWPVTVVWLLAMTNLINLIDGVDGLAGGICLMLTLLLVYVSWNTGLTGIFAAGTAGALLGFLYFNFPPARIYLGAGGTYLLGWLIGCDTILSSQKGTVFAALAAPLFVLALPIIDTALAILRRGLHGLPLFHGDGKQVHQRLLASGHSRRNVVLGLYGFSAFFLLLGFLAFYWHGEYFALLLGIGTLAVILAAGRLDFSREWFFVGRVLGNSMQARADIQYAMNLSHCLALEGTRAENLASLAGDVVLIARKLDFSAVKIRLEDDEKIWRLTETPAAHLHSFKFPLAGREYCFLELSVANPDDSAENGKLPESRLNTFSIEAELVAEAWNQAVQDWRQAHRLPPRFDAVSTSAPAADLSREFQLSKA